MADTVVDGGWSAALIRYVEAWQAAEPAVQITSVLCFAAVAIAAIVALLIHRRHAQSGGPEALVGTLSDRLVALLDHRISQIDERLDGIRADLNQIRQDVDEVVKNCPECPHRPKLDDAGRRLGGVDRAVDECSNTASCERRGGRRAR